MSKWLFFASMLAAGWPAEAHNLMPVPAKMTPGQGRLAIDASFRVGFEGYQEARLKDATARLVRQLVRQTGIPIPLEAPGGGTPAALLIHCGRASDTVQNLREDESYRLRVTAGQTQLTAPTPLGVLRGLATFAQLVELDAQGFGVPTVEIVDSPRFAWRGLMIDVARHWIPLEVLKRHLDGMAAVKLNVFHWHLSDDQGFRIESRKFPKLQQMGSDGHYFTQQQVRELLAYARERGIRVVPEFDMPGHTSAWFPGYPELAAGPGPHEIERSWGIFDPCMDPTREEVYRFLDGFIGEMAALFPDEYFHIGGDEVNGKLWDSAPRIAEFKRQHGMRSNEDLQAYFTRRVQALVRKHGKKMIGWDEILHPDLPKDIVVQSWRGPQGLAQAARQGFRAILSNGYYLDLMHSAADHYLVDPLGGAASELTAEQKGRILGGEACMWMEYATERSVDARIWPRMAAIAERLWSPQEVRDVADMYRRLAAVSRELDWAGVDHQWQYEQALERLAGEGPVEPVRVLAEVVEPIKNYGRGQARKYTQQTPLNRLVDTAQPASDRAREFSELVERLPASEADVRRWLMLWRDNDARLQPLLRNSALLAEAAPVSANLAAVAVAGLEALEYRQSGRAPSTAWRQEKLGVLDRAAAPQAEVLLSVVPPIRKLIQSIQ
ncbi:MAG TPA: family 20 glycosylhydrolase [Bryobacteraceae bacterium]|nr:family 20 glycosylhydrolase [Bryobacteraceae bacterium]